MVKPDENSPFLFIDENCSEGRKIQDVVIKCVNAIKAKENVSHNRETLKEISQNAVIPAHFHLSYGENSGGIHTATPPGVLHI